MCARVHLPTELVDHICGYLDKPDLAKCTLLCWHWYMSACAPLYHTIIVLDVRTDKLHHLETFTQFLKSNFTSSLSRCVKHLTIRGIDVEVAAPRCKRMPVDTYQLGRLLAAGLPALRVLQLERILLRFQTNKRRGQEFPGLRVDLERLKLKHVRYMLQGVLGDADDVSTSDARCSIVELLHLFTSVDTLDLIDVQPGGMSSNTYNLRGAYAAGRRLREDFRITSLTTPLIGRYTHNYILAVLRGSHSTSLFKFPGRSRYDDSK